jgi:hypothetical protein
MAGATGCCGYLHFVELIAAALVVVGLLAIVTRFVARDPSGEFRLPRIIDRSIGMWLLRRLTGLRLGARDDDLEPVAPAPAMAVADRSAVPLEEPVRAAVGVLNPSLIGTTRRAPPVASPGTRRSRRLGLRSWPWPSLAGPLAMAIAFSIVGLGATAVPREPRGEVLGIVGTPLRSGGPAETKRAGADASRSDGLGLPPAASIVCDPAVLRSVTCSATGSTGALTYAFDFGDGTGSSAGSSSSETHTYVVPGDYTVTLTVRDARDGLDEQSTTVSIP